MKLGPFEAEINKKNKAFGFERPESVKVLASR